jgi:F0F1-type ATP synthase assembly protein I
MSEPEERSPYSYVGWVSGLGVTMIACILVGLYLGISADRTLHTSPLFSFIFVILGMLAGGWVIYKGIMRELISKKK